MVDSIVEFEKKYNKTYFRWIQKDMSMEVVSLEFCDHIESLVMLSSPTIGNVSKSYPKILEEVVLDSPESGYFNHNEHALYLFKNPARQWQRGLCGANHEIYNPFKKLFTEGTYRPIFGRSSVLAMFNKNLERNVSKAIEQIMERNPLKSIAITSNLMLSKSPSIISPSPLIWYKTTPVGFVRGNKFVCEDELYQQEIHDELHRIGEERWIS